MTKTQALNRFWSSFGIPAFDETSVQYAQSKPKMPYITYQVISGSFGEQIQTTASVYYYGGSWIPANDKTQEISEYIGLGGVMQPCDGGALYITRGTPFAQSMGDDKDYLVRRKVLNISIEYLTAN